MPSRTTTTSSQVTPEAQDASELHEREEFFNCQCHSPGHVLRASIWVWSDGMPELEFGFHLAPWMPFWHRLWAAIKLILGLSPTHDHFDGWMMKSEDSKRLRILLEHYEAISALRAKRLAKEKEKEKAREV